MSRPPLPPASPPPGSDPARPSASTRSTGPAGPSLGRVVTPALLLTAASGVFLVALDHPADVDPALEQVSVDGVAVAPSIPSTTATPSTNATPSTSSPSSGQRSAASTTTVPAAPTCTGETLLGPSVSTRWGPVQVQAVVADDGTLCDVEAVDSPSGDRRSASISQRAIPTLNRQALAAQDADIDGVSGATYTSNGYARSLQAILDSVG